MLKILANRTYRHLFLAQVIALVGTGLATVALGLLAFDLAGAQAGAVLGTALAIKMTAYIGVAPIAAASFRNWRRSKVGMAVHSPADRMIDALKPRPRSRTVSVPKVRTMFAGIRVSSSPARNQETQIGERIPPIQMRCAHIASPQTAISPGKRSAPGASGHFSAPPTALPGYYSATRFSALTP